jgi:hypothetical protein
MSDAKAPKSKPKRDPNKPLPKPKKKSSFLIKLAVSGFSSVLVLWIGLYSFDLGRGPWDWKGDDWKGFLTFSQAQVEQAVEQAQKVDWEAIADTITAETKKLYDKIPAWENKLDDTIAKLEKEEGQQQATEGGQGEASAEPLQAEPSAYMKGCTKFRAGIRAYKKAFAKGASRSQQKTGLAEAKGLFEQAQEHFEVAEREAQEAGDQNLLAEIGETREECGRYLYDCVKLDKL